MLKKTISVLLASSALFAGDVMYSIKDKPVYSDATSTKVIGKLLPTNAIEVLGEEGDRVKFKIKGYQNPTAPNVIYFTDKARIFSLAFSKTATPDIKVDVKGENGKWNSVSVDAYTSKSDLESKVEPMMEKAQKLYSDNCSICHTLNTADHFTANQWPATFRGMSDRTPIQKDEVWLVIEYLQKNASDMKK